MMFTDSKSLFAVTTKFSETHEQRLMIDCDHKYAQKITLDNHISRKNPNPAETFGVKEEDYVSMETTSTYTFTTKLEKTQS